MAGCDHVAILGAEVAAFAGVRIQAAHGDARPRRCPRARRTSSCEDAQRGIEQRGRDRIADGAQRQVRGGERHAQGVRPRAASPDARAPVRAARYSVWPVNGTPASLITLFCTGAVTMAANSPLAQPSMARSSSASTCARVGGVEPARARRARPAARRAPAGGPAARRRLRRRVDRDRACTSSPSWRARSASSARLPMIDERAGKVEAGESETEIRADAGGFTRGDGDALARPASELVLDVGLVAQATQPELGFLVGLRFAQRREGALADARPRWCRTGGGLAAG